MAVTGKVKQRVWKRDNWVCCYCYIDCTYNTGFSTDATVEHIVSKQDGGSNSMNNLMTACRKCNFVRGRCEEKTLTFNYK